jgi:ketosteroid isomerase-like protein
MERDNGEIVEAFREAIASGDMGRMSAMLEEYASDDFVQEWPQSGERIRGKEMSRRLNEAYPSATGTSPRIEVRRISGSGDVYVIEGTVDYGDGTPVSYVGIAEFRDGKVAKMTEYFANPFEAPDWRSQYVERMEPATV